VFVGVRLLQERPRRAAVARAVEVHGARLTATAGGHAIDCQQLQAVDAPARVLVEQHLVGYPGGYLDVPRTQPQRHVRPVHTLVALAHVPPVHGGRKRLSVCVLVVGLVEGIGGRPGALEALLPGELIVPAAQGLRIVKTAGRLGERVVLPALDVQQALLLAGPPEGLVIPVVHLQAGHAVDAAPESEPVLRGVDRLLVIVLPRRVDPRPRGLVADVQVLRGGSPPGLAGILDELQLHKLPVLVCLPLVVEERECDLAHHLDAVGRGDCALQIAGQVEQVGVVASHDRHVPREPE